MEVPDRGRLPRLQELDQQLPDALESVQLRAGQPLVLQTVHQWRPQPQLEGVLGQSPDLHASNEDPPARIAMSLSRQHELQPGHQIFDLGLSTAPERPLLQQDMLEFVHL